MKQLYPLIDPSYFSSRRIRLLCIASLFLLVSAPKNLNAQLIINAPVTAQDIVQTLLGCGSAASNITLSSCGTSCGFFNAVNTNLGIDTGVLLSSGDVYNAVGPNNSGFQTTDNGCPGYPPLNTLSGSTTYNAAVLDFDVLLNTDTLKFNYVFGSEEYMEWVYNGSVFNDVFALWISGPGITGLVNLAVLPGGLPVTQANVNCTTGNGNYYICNDPTNSQCNSSYNCPTNQGMTTLQYDGFTKVLQAKIAVTAGNTYHLTFAIADAGDPVYDSGVFIQADFLSPYTVSVVSDPVNFINPFDSTLSIVEGCQPGIINVHLENLTSDTIYLPLAIGGTATAGTDYTALDDTLMFVPGDTVHSIFIGAFADGVAEGNESVIIYTLDPCTGAIADSFVINIVDDFPFIVSNDTTICEHDSLAIGATFSPYYHYQWQPAAYVSCDTCSSTTAFPPFSTAMVVGVTLGNCTTYDTVSVQVTQVDPFAGNDQNLCYGDTTGLLAVGGTSYIWTPSTGLSNPMIANPIAFPTVTTNYIVTAIGTNPLCQDNDSVLVNVVPNLVGAAGMDTSVCPGKPVQLWATGGDFYDWEPSTYLDYNETAAPLSTPFLTTTYTVVVSNVYDCKDTVKVKVTVFDDPTITVNQPYDIYTGETAQLFIHAGLGSSYSWQPNDKLSDPNAYNPIAAPDSSTTYYVVITTADGCLYTESTKVNILNETLIIMPNAFTPNGDGLNEELKIISRGPVTLHSYKIFDRWGNDIFSTADINQGWDGKIRGKAAGIGTYVYLIEGLDGNSQHFIRHGNFLLLR